MSRETELRALAANATPGPWKAYFTTHGDPHVVEAGKGLFGVIATVGTAPDDYGRDNARFMASVDPETAAALYDVVEAARKLQALKDGPRNGTYYNTKDDAWNRLRAALAAFDLGGEEPT
jgi:hypothetical protein